MNCYRSSNRRHDFDLAISGAILAALGVVTIMAAAFGISHMPVHPRAGEMTFFLIVLLSAGALLSGTGIYFAAAGITGRR